MKKFGLAFVALVLVFVIYYMTTGSKQIRNEMKSEVNKNLIELKQYGFGVKEENLSKDKQHIVLTFQDADKISNYLTKQSKSKILNTDIEILKGMQLAIDIEYMPTAKDALSMDIYPIKLPNLFYQDITTNEEKELLKEFEKMVKDKVFLAHININKLLNSFDGYLKDIDRVIKFSDTNESMHLLSKGFKFKGTLDNEKFNDLNQKLDIFSITMPNEFDINLSGFKYNVKNLEDFSNQKIDYTIKSFTLINKPVIGIKMNGIVGYSKKELKGKFLNTSNNSKIDSVDLDNEGNKIRFEKVTLGSQIKNMNKEVFDKLEELSSKDDSNNIQELLPLLKALIKDNILIEVPNISAQKIVINGNSFDGFKISAKLNADKNVNLQNINSIDSIINILNAKIDIEASNEFISYIATNPQMVIMMMVIQPIEKNGKKYFNIEFSKGSLKVNGKPLM
jgi:Na+-transporting methylmalonyl-CoA/oxaloacetate decarboxylase gamma subunit